MDDLWIDDVDNSIMCDCVEVPCIDHDCDCAHCHIR